jgi:iron-sulfur cluster assembly protein
MIKEQVEAPPQFATSEWTPVELTPTAVEKLREVMSSKGLAEAGLRVFVSGGGCSGLQYGMAFETGSGEEDDHVFTSAGVIVFVDPVSIGYLQGARIDFEDSLMGGGFKIENPNAVSSCGCGHSFKTSSQQAEAAGAGGGGGCGCH